MKIYIFADMEGISGICGSQMVSTAEGTAEYQRGRKYLTAEVNNCIKACFDSGADEVVLKDGHGGGCNILWDELEHDVVFVQGYTLDTRFAELEGSDGIILLGYHAMAGTPCAITPHSKWCVNGGEIYLSEASMAAALAGDKNIPTVMASGDDKIGAELLSKMPDLEFAQVKRAVSPYLACSMIPAASCKLIYQKVCAGLAKRKEIRPYKIDGPVSLILFDSDNHVPPFKAYGEEVKAETISEAFSSYLRSLPWYNMNLQDADGFQFPMEKSCN